MKLNDFILPLWRRIPAGLRQKVAHSLLNVMTPSLPDVEPREIADRSVPRIVVGFLSSSSGLGQSARLLAAALREGGYPVFGIDLSRYFFEVADTIEHGLPDGRSITGQAHVIININAPYMPYVLWLLGRRFLRRKYVTGYWAWELPRLPENWRRGFFCVHDIAVPSTFVAEAVRKIDAGKRVMVLPHPVAVECHASELVRHDIRSNDGTGPFTVGFMANIGSGFARKNPLALIAAFRRAFGNDSNCRLKMLLTNAEHYHPARQLVESAVGGAGNIEISWQSLGRAELSRWWHGVDVYASLHRSEGFGLPLAEAMCRGLPVVATGWSGNMEFMTEENSFPVNYTFVEVRDEQGKYPSCSGKWAEPDIEHAAELLQLLHSTPELASSMGTRAKADVLTALSGSAFICEMKHGLID